MFSDIVRPDRSILGRWPVGFFFPHGSGSHFRSMPCLEEEGRASDPYGFSRHFQGIPGNTFVGGKYMKRGTGLPWRQGNRGAFRKVIMSDSGMWAATPQLGAFCFLSNEESQSRRHLADVLIIEAMPGSVMYWVLLIIPAGAGEVVIGDGWADKWEFHLSKT